MRTFGTVMIGLILGLLVAGLVIEAIARPLVNDAGTVSTGQALVLGLAWPVFAASGVLVAVVIRRRRRNR